MTGIVKGFKATDKDMKCRGYQYELGKWHKHDGDLKLCESGFHFCKYPSGVWAFHNKPGTRVFEVEAKDVLDLPVEPGAEYKLVCRKIRLVRELEIGGDGNTGKWNTGNRNTGDGNTGHRNTGYGNTGNRNTGNGNTGNRNTGNGNTGHWNTGDRNTGNGNTGHWNTGDGNTGNRNTGDSNTGHWNVGDFHSGYFCQKEETVKCFDVDTRLGRKRFQQEYGDVIDILSRALTKDEPIDFARVKSLPGITRAKLKSLHRKHIAGRKP